ncbi:MAG: TIGR04255 family protein [Fimbriimonadaceae bacterium]|nr:MAG: TIGR04255 family protein [Fimbriimonadaceae bacterium]
MRSEDGAKFDDFTYTLSPIREAMFGIQFEEDSPDCIHLLQKVESALSDFSFLDHKTNSKRKSGIGFFPLSEAHPTFVISNDYSIVVQASKRTFAVNYRSPYKGWHVFQIQLKNIFSAIEESLSANSIHDTCLRYVNQVNMSKMGERSIFDLFELLPLSPSTYEVRDVGNFSIKLEYDVAEQRMLVADMSTYFESDENYGVSLIVSSFDFVEQPLDLRALMSSVDEQHLENKKFWRAAIRDELHQFYLSGGKHE